MQKLFNNVLIPVDFSTHSNNAIGKAIEFARLYKCSIHLLHVITTAVFSPTTVADANMYMPGDDIENETQLESELNKLCRSIDQLSGGNVATKGIIATGSWNTVIIDSIKQNNIDLVLITMDTDDSLNRKSAVNPDKIAVVTNVPVITVPFDRKLVKLHSIVIPVTDFLPIRKLMYGIYLAKEYNSTLLLLGITNNATGEKTKYYMDKSCQMIVNDWNLAIQRDFVNAQNVAKAVYHYTIQKFADLVILNPGSQTNMPGLFSALRGNIIQRYSIPPVLVVNQL